MTWQHILGRATVYDERVAGGVDVVAVSARHDAGGVSVTGRILTGTERESVDRFEWRPDGNCRLWVSGESEIKAGLRDHDIFFVPDLFPGFDVSYLAMSMDTGREGFSVTSDNDGPVRTRVSAWDGSTLIVSVHFAVDLVV